MSFSDVFGVLPQRVKNVNTIQKLDTIFSTTSKNIDINWQHDLYNFFINKLDLYQPTNYNYIVQKIKILLKQSSNHLDNFIHINSLFEIVNDLNISFNQISNYKNYTYIILQNIYMSIILDSENVDYLNFWFEGLNNINLELYDGKHKTKFHRSLEILKKYLYNERNIDTSIGTTIEPRISTSVGTCISVTGSSNISARSIRYNAGSSNITEFISITDSIDMSEYKSSVSNILNEKFTSRIKNINNFYKRYVEWIFNKYNNNNLEELYNKFVKLNKINFEITDYLQNKQININNSLNIYNNDVFTNTYFIKLVPLLDSYLKSSNDSEEIFKIFSNIDLTKTEYINIIRDHIDNQLTKIKSNLSINHDSKSFSEIIIKEFQKVIHFIKYFKDGFNKSTNIIKLFETIINNEELIKKLLWYNLKDDNMLQFISLYKNKETFWNIYNDNLVNNLNKLTNYGKLDKVIIDSELENVNKLILLGCQNHSENIIKLLNNYNNSLIQTTNIHNCKINYYDKKNTLINDLDLPLDKTTFIVIDKHIQERKISHQIIDQTMYPKDILNCLNVGKAYYKNIYDIKKVEWDFEKSVINYTIFDITYISNIIQYTIISYILKNNVAEIDDISQNLINKLLTDKVDVTINIINKYIHHMIDKKIIVKNDKDIYIINHINKKIIDISSYTPVVKIITTKKNIVVNNDFTPEAITFLRQCMLVKLFKINSTIQISLSSIKPILQNTIDSYLKSSNTMLPQVIEVIRNLYTIDDITLVKDLQLLESKDVIEKTKTGAYIYIV